MLFLAYVCMIFVPFWRHRQSLPGDPGALRWHFIVPCRDEEAVIERTVSGLVATFPACHIWVIDDASEDATLQIVRGLEQRHPQVHVIARRYPDARLGKGAALNAAWRVIDAAVPADTPRSQVVVGVVDADAVLDPNVLAMVAGPDYFGDPATGAVQIQVRIFPDPFRPVDDQPSIPRRHRLLIALQDLEFTGPIAAMQMLRARTGSVAMGGNGQFTRLSVLNDVASRHGTPWHGALLEDFELGLHVLLAGSRTGYCHDTYVVQEGVPGARDLLRQRSRWAQGSMQCLQYLRDVLRTRHLTTAGTLEIAYFLFSPWVQLVGGVVYLSLFASAAHYATSDPLGVGNWWSGGAWGLLPLFLTFGLAPFMIWAFMYRRRVRPELSLWQTTGLGLVNALYVYLHQASTWWAFYRVMTARTDWKKTVRYSGKAPAPSAAPAPAPRPAPAASEALGRLRAVPPHVPGNRAGAAGHGSVALSRLRRPASSATGRHVTGRHAVTHRHQIGGSDPVLVALHDGTGANHDKTLQSVNVTSVQPSPLVTTHP